MGARHGADRSHRSRRCRAPQPRARRRGGGAKADDDFAAVLPKLADLLALVRETAAAKAERLGLSPYDALLDEYEPDGRADEIDGVFADLARFLPDFLPRVIERQARAPAPLEPGGPFPIDKQRAVAVRLMERLGFDFHHGRLDVSLHPFCGGTPDDVRITTRYDEADFRSALMGVMHETGHALYERGLPAAWRGQPVGDARGMVLHESQSLLIEMQVCRSRAFLAFAAPAAARGVRRRRPGVATPTISTATTPASSPASSGSMPTRSPIPRTSSSATTWSGRWSRANSMPADLPGAWNDGMRELLGITPPDDRLGCLQDIHWYDGAWGYFPTYTLGAMAAAQIFRGGGRRRCRPSPTAIARGEFAPLVGLVARQRARQRLAASDARAADRSDRPPARPGCLQGAPAAALPRLNAPPPRARRPTCEPAVVRARAR